MDKIVVNVITGEKTIAPLTAEEIALLVYPTDAEIKEQLIAHYKSLYLGVVEAKLKEKDYDSLATVKLWEGDATFGAEATKILTWYKSIIAYNYGLLGTVTAENIPTDAEYLAGIPVYV